MSLKLYFNTDEAIKQFNIESDVETLFSRTKLHGSDIEKELISVIENGKYESQNSFIDRFGYKLPISFLSTGCKAALCIVNNPDKPISLIECGHNAIDSILAKCTNGAVIDTPHYSAVYSGDNTIDVEMDGRKFNSIKTLNNYIANERI